MIGICKCGCGGSTTLWKQSCSKKGVKKGQPRDFIKGHYRKIKGKASCHPERDIKASGLCGSCYNKLLINRNEATRDAYLKAQIERAKTRKIKAGPAAWSAAQRNRALRYRYGLDAKSHEEMTIAQGNRCAICDASGGETRATRLYVDHNHTTGVVRKLLCPGCNIAIGIIEQGVERISQLAAYLSYHEPENTTWNALAVLQLELDKVETLPENLDEDCAL